MGGRRLEENPFIVRYCIEEIYRLARELIVVAIDFEKLYDSVGSLALVRALKFYRCEPRLIDVIVNLYVGDRTEVWRGGEVLGDFDLTFLTKPNLT